MNDEEDLTLDQELACLMFLDAVDKQIKVMQKMNAQLAAVTAESTRLLRKIQTKDLGRQMPDLIAAPQRLEPFYE